MDPSTMTTTASEALSSTSAFGGATACAECLSSFGVDPTIAGALAVILGVVVRLAVDWAQRELSRRRALAPPPVEVAVDRPKDPPS